ncbi:21484_t:CDS:2, partial [Rhizophagus irregularis]
MLVYISLWILFQLLIEINCQISPDKRRRHTATLVDNKLYILGGSEINKVGKDFLYIDFSVPFNTRNLLLTDLSKVNIVPPHFGAGSAKGGANNDTNSWSIPKINGDAPPVLASASTTVIDQKGKMYLWAGIGSNVPILDTINLVWTKGSSVGAPNVGLLASATTLLPDNKIIYLEDTNNDNISQIYIYDTVNDNWTTKATSGTIPPKKSGMSVILGLDGQRVIIFGGLDFTSKEQLYELSLINFVWRIPKTSGIAPKESRNAHRANVIGNYMVISYGSGYTTENDILLLDISNVNEYIWTNEFKPSSSISISVKTTS